MMNAADFVRQDFEDTLSFIREALADNDERRLRALTSNNLNVILAALKRCANDY